MLISPALLIVDVQVGFVTEHTASIPMAVQEIQNYYHHVFISKFVNPDGSPFRKLMKWNKFSPGSSDIDLAFIPVPRSRIFEKDIYTCVDDNFLRILDKERIDTIDICGIDTDICVMKSAADLFENSITPRVLAEYCASTAGDDHHKAALKIIGRYIGRDQIIYNHVTLQKKIVKIN